MTLIVAHRGASGSAPENTIEAFRLAVEAGADAIELDVHLTADGQLAVIHDETLDRTTDRTGAVAELTMDEIRQADAGAGFAGVGGEYPYRGRGLTVPTLPEVLDWLPGRLGLVVEIKARAAPDAVVEALHGRAVRDEERVSVISFDERSIDRVRELDRGIRTGYLLVPGQDVEAALVWATEHGHVGVHPWDPDLGLDPSRILVLAKAYGREVGCYVVNDPARMRHLAASGLWGFVTDVPEMARAALPRAG
ncbi:MAG TPA: glycerophosphodiester phosphodiesterase family protein [Candidatus Limnocylindria bacterium]